MKNNMNQLEKKGFVGVAYPDALRKAVMEAMISWKGFCSLPEEVRSSFPYSNEGAGVGYERKGKDTPSPDPKENFDSALGGKEWLDQVCRRIDNPKVDEFVSAALSLNAQLKPFITAFAGKLEEAFGVPGFAAEVEQSENAYFCRFIHYFGDRAPGEETAGAHPDQSGFTLHLFESDPGLQCFTFEGSWEDMPVSETETVIIPSMQLQLLSKGRLKALTHRVIATESTAKTGRYSAVCFVQLANTPKYDKNTHGRLQKMVIDRGPGFNYKMVHEDFAELFQK
jgi:isopenicillin N synthase-like dioxygenase